MSRWSVRGSAVAILCLSVLAAACTGAAPSSSPTGSDPAAGTDRTWSPAAPHETAPTPGTSGFPAPDGPPAAALVVDGGDPAIGQLGSFTWDGGGSDSPWLPGTPLVVGSGEPLTVALTDGVGVGDWSARRVPAGTTDGTGAVPLGAGGPPLAFAAPLAGTWSVQVTVQFAGGRGSAAYYWQLRVR